MIQHATINGRSHHIFRQNSHDFALSGGAGEGVCYGLALDGCGSKPSHNEVGATLLGQFAASTLQQALAALDDQQEPAYDHDLASRLVARGMPIAALTPQRFAEWLAEVIQ